VSDKKCIAIASDHAGFALKTMVKELLVAEGYTVRDLGADSEESVDYPDFGYAMGEVISSGEVQYGIVICGSGIGISIAANRFKSVRAALCHSVETAKLSRQHNDANVLALGARVLDQNIALECVDTFLTTGFEGDRHQRRVNKLGEKGE